jgi:hypothetical protein
MPMCAILFLVQGVLEVVLLFLFELVATGLDFYHISAHDPITFLHEEITILEVIVLIYKVELRIAVLDVFLIVI